MRINVISRNLPASDAMRAHASRRLRTALDHLGHRIESVAVRLSDVNGPRGGEDTDCRVHVRLSPSGSVVLTSRHSDAYSAIDDAATRLKKAVMRAIDRRCPRRGSKGPRTARHES